MIFELPLWCFQESHTNATATTYAATNDAAGSHGREAECWLQLMQMMRMVMRSLCVAIMWPLRVTPCTGGVRSASDKSDQRQISSARDPVMMAAHVTGQAPSNNGCHFPSDRIIHWTSWPHTDYVAITGLILHALLLLLQQDSSSSASTVVSQLFIMSLSDCECLLVIVSVIYSTVPSVVSSSYSLLLSNGNQSCITYTCKWL